MRSSYTIIFKSLAKKAQKRVRYKRRKPRRILIMYVVSNRIKVKKGFAEKMAPRFTKPGPLQEMNGFEKVEVLVTQNLEEHDELNVNMYWNTLEDFQAWKESDAFKQAHSRPSGGQEGQESPLLGSQLVIAEVASTLHSEK